MNIQTMVQAQDISEILTMKGGSSLIYHVGYLAKDRMGGSGGRTQQEKDAERAADIAWKLHENGSVFLTQRRLGREMFEYIATRAKGK